MAKQITKLQVLVAYPDDVAEERDLLEDVARELNNTWSETLGIQLELIDWKTHSWPSFGTDAQAVINEQIGDEYDIFLGIMWLRFGEPTPRAESGTAEEFNRALERFKNNPDKIRIMFYFKDAPPPSLKDLDLEQLRLIREFKERVDREGGRYAEFKNAEQFASAVRAHLSKHAQEWGKTWGLGQAAERKELVGPAGTADMPNADEEEEEGFLDLIERSVESFETLSESMQRMNAAMEFSTTRIQEKSKEMNELNQQGADLKQRKRLINSMAEIMDQYTSQLEAELPQFSTTFGAAIGSMSKAISIWHEDQFLGQEQASTAYEQLKILPTGLYSYLESLGSLKTTISGMPRATSVFNRSKRRMTTALEELIADIQSGLKLTEDLQTHFGRILEEQEKRNGPPSGN